MSKENMRESKIPCNSCEIPARADGDIRDVCFAWGTKYGTTDNQFLVAGHYGAIIRGVHQITNYNISISLKLKSQN